MRTVRNQAYSDAFELRVSGGGGGGNSGMFGRERRWWGITLERDRR